MTELSIDFSWPVAGRYVAIEGDKPEPNVSKLGGAIDRIEIGAGGEVKRQNPVGIASKLYLHFKELPPTLEECRSFASMWGFLKSNNASEGVSEPLYLWQKSIQQMNEFIGHMSVFQGGKDKAPGLYRIYEAVGWSACDVEVALVPRPSDGQMAITLRPKTLLDAMFLQAAQSVASGRKLRSCQECGTWFEAGGGAARREDASFCTDRCRNRHNNRGKVKA